MMFASWGPYWVKTTSVPLYESGLGAIYYYDRISATSEINKLAKISVGASHYGSRVEIQAIEGSGPVTINTATSIPVMRDGVNDQVIICNTDGSIQNYLFHKLTAVNIVTCQETWSTTLPGAFGAFNLISYTMLGCTNAKAWVLGNVFDTSAGGWYYAIYGLNLLTGAIEHTFKLSMSQTIPGGSTAVLLSSLLQHIVALDDTHIYIGCGLYDAQNGGVGPNYQAYILNVVDATTYSWQVIGPIDRVVGNSPSFVSHDLAVPNTIFIGYNNTGAVATSRMVAIVDYVANTVSYLTAPTGQPTSVFNVQVDTTMGKAWLVADSGQSLGRQLIEYSYPGFAELGRYGNNYQYNASSTIATSYGHSYQTYRVYGGAVYGFAVPGGGSGFVSLWLLGQYTADAGKIVMNNELATQTNLPSFIPKAFTLSNSSLLDVQYGKHTDFVFGPEKTFNPTPVVPTITATLSEAATTVILSSKITWCTFTFDGTKTYGIEQINNGVTPLGGRALLRYDSFGSPGNDDYSHAFTVTGSVTSDATLTKYTYTALFANTLQASPGYLASAQTSDFAINGNFSFSTWFRADELTVGGNTLMALDSGAGTDYVHIDINGAVASKLSVTYVAGGSTTIATSSSNVTPLTWVHLEVNVVGTSLFVFLDGILEATASLPTLSTAATMRLVLGMSPYRGGSGFGFRGRFEDTLFMQDVVGHISNFGVPFKGLAAPTSTYAAYIFDSSGEFASFNASTTVPVLRMENALPGTYYVAFVNTLNDYNTIISPSSNKFRLIVKEPANTVLAPQTLAFRLVAK
jgi:hypothetical protein